MLCNKLRLAWLQNNLQDHLWPCDNSCIRVLAPCPRKMHHPCPSTTFATYQGMYHPYMIHPLTSTYPGCITTWISPIYRACAIVYSNHMVNLMLLAGVPMYVNRSQWFLRKHKVPLAQVGPECGECILYIIYTASRMHALPWRKDLAGFERGVFMSS